MLSAQNEGSSIWKRYKAVSLLGQGVYGKVNRAINRETGRVVAIKETVSDVDGILSTTLREVAIMSKLSHRNIIGLIEADQCMLNHQVFVVMEYCSQDLDQFIKKRGPLMNDPVLVQIFMDHLLSGLSELHSFGILHRDIKPQNLLIAACKKERYLLKIADFGLGRRASANLTTFTPEIQTMLYRAPELFTMVPKYCEAIDIWSAACVFAEMLRGEPLFRGSREIELFQFIIRTLGEPTIKEWQVLDPQRFQEQTYDRGDKQGETPEYCELFPGLDKFGLDLISLMFRYNPVERITALKALHHDYFQDFKDEDFVVIEEREDIAS